MTVTLSNYDIENNGRDISQWYTTVQHGSGAGRPAFTVLDGDFEKIKPAILDFKSGSEFITQVERELLPRTANAEKLQSLYERRSVVNGFLEPIQLVEEVAQLVEALTLERQFLSEHQVDSFQGKKRVPAKQLFALYAINRIASAINGEAKIHEQRYATNSKS